MYSLQVSLILFAMITTGAVRSVGIKLFYQMGFENPFFVTLMFHLSGIPSFAFYGLHWCVKWWRTSGQTTAIVTAAAQRQRETNEAAPEVNDADQPEEQSGSSHSILQDSRTNGPSLRRVRIDYQAMGSQTGLTEESHATAASLLNKLPWYGKLFLVGLFNFLTYILQWNAILLMLTSVAEMLLNGGELVLTVLGSQLIHKQQVSHAWWAGVWIVMVGLIIIGVTDVLFTLGGKYCVSTGKY
jgi:drug/metabolite transporter (DMT)-like permease